MGSKRIYVNVSPWTVEGAANGDQTSDGADRLNPMGMMLRRGNQHDGGAWTVGSEHARRIHNRLRRNPADARHPFRRIFLNMLFKLWKAYRPIAHKILVVKLFIDDDVEHSQGKGSVRSRQQGHVNIGLLGDRRPARIDNDNLGAVLPGVFVTVHRGMG